MLRTGFFIALTACGFHPGAATSDDAIGGDSAPPIASCSDHVKDGDETNVDCGGSCAACSTCTVHALPPTINVDPKPFAAKFLSAPQWSCTSTGITTIDSDAGTVVSTTCDLGSISVANGVPQLDSTGVPVFVVRLQGLRVTNGHVLRVIGDKPVVILVAGDVIVDTNGMIDASAAGATPGPGGSPLSCANRETGLGTMGTNTGWGGGGGGFGTAGGQGCYMTINGGAVTGSQNLVPLRGGCPGGTSQSAGQGGAGGGAIEIAASGRIKIGETGIANIAASGGGGRNSDGGGNGGGAGGGILLVAPANPMLGTMGALRTNGGSGTGGASAVGTSSNDGGDGHTADNNAATDTSGTGGGGNGNDNGRTGGLANRNGNGGLKTAAGNTTGQQNGGRGGGGGGGGRIVVTTSPAATSCD